jgi:uncharacterized Rmd1/YagE family protein
MIKAGANGYAVLFRYGAIILFNLTATEEATFLMNMRPFIKGPYETPEVEEQLIGLEQNVAEGVLEDKLYLRQLSVERLQLVAEILAKSVALAYYEKLISKAVETVEPLAANLSRKAGAGASGRQLLRHIGDTLAIEYKMIGRIEVHEKPELLWDIPGLEKLYLRLEDEYELAERHAAVEQKLDLIARTAETILELLRHQSSLRVEWYITILIVIEIAITLYQWLFLGTGH